MAERYDAVMGVKYTRDGIEKTSWTKIGVAFPNRSGEGFNVKLEAVPAPQDGAIRFMLFPPSDNQRSAPPLDDEIGF